MKYVNQLTDNELTELYKSFMSPNEKFVELSIGRYDDDKIWLEGYIRIPVDEYEYSANDEYADDDGYCEIEESYPITDYNAESFFSNENVSKQLREFLYKKFGAKYAEDYLFDC